MKSRKFHEIPGFRGNPVKSHDAAGGEKRKEGGPPGPPGEVGTVRIMSTANENSYPFSEDFSILRYFEISTHCRIFCVPELSVRRE